MADQIVSWGGFNSKGTDGLGITGPLIVTGSTSITGSFTVSGRGNTNIGDIGYSTINLNGGVNVSNTGPNTGTSLTVSGGGNVSMRFDWDNINNVTSAVSSASRILRFTGASQYQVRGSGTTSSTTALLVQNANASASFSVRDDQSIIINGSSSMTIPNSGSALTIKRTGNYNNIGSQPLVNIIDDSNHANVSKTAVYISATGASNNKAMEIYGGVGIGTPAYDLQVKISYPTFLNNTSSVFVGSNFGLSSKSSISSDAAGNGGGISFYGDDRGQANAQVAFAGIRGVKENSTYLNSLGNLVFYVQSGSAGGLTETTFKEAARFNSSGSFGIGTTTPSASLHISGSSGSALLEIDSPAVNNILYVSGSGNVGIGTGSPSTLLNLKQVNSSTSILRLDSSTSVGSNTYEVGVDFYSRITGAGGTDSYPVGKIYGTGGSEFRSGKLRFQTIITNGGSLTDTITLYQGNVGIGSLNTTPSTLLQVTGLKDTVVADFSSNTVGLNE